MRKFIVMVAGMLLATCFVASATALKKLSKGMTNGGEYILSFLESGKVLVVEDDILMMVSMDEFDSYSYAKRDSNTWITRWTTDATGKKAYTFTNKVTGKLLTLPPNGTQSDVLVNWEGGISKFTWKDDPTSPDSASISGNISETKQIKLCKAIMVKNDFTGSKQTYAQLAADTANCREIVCTFALDSESVPSISDNINDAFGPFSSDGGGEDGEDGGDSGNTTNNVQKKSSSNGLSTGATAGIIVASVVIVVVMVVVAVVVGMSISTTAAAGGAAAAAVGGATAVSSQAAFVTGAAGAGAA